MDNEMNKEPIQETLEGAVAETPPESTGMEENLRPLFSRLKKSYPDQSFEKDDKLNHFDDYVEFVNTYIPNFIGKKDEIIKLTSNDGIDIYVTWVEC